MKKNVLALSIAAAVAGFGMVGGVHAMTNLGGATAGSTLSLKADGVGQMLLVPYFTTQDNNATLINIVNTDLVYGKAVKIRFRGAANSDDIYDFQVFLSPGDVWTANVSKNASGLSLLTTQDNSCTKPAKNVTGGINVAPFVTARLDSTLTDAQKANGTREGYIEIFNMADIPPKLGGAAALTDAAALALNAGEGGAGVDATAGATANPLFTAIKHSAAGVPPCSGTAWTNLDTANLSYGAAVAVTVGAPGVGNAASAGFLPPSSGLMGNWTIINTVGAAAWSGEAVAVGTTVNTDRGNVVYWPQTGLGVGTPAINAYTADALLRQPTVAGVGAIYSKGAIIAAAGAPAVTAGFYDLPDLSTPYVAVGAATPSDQALSLTSAIAASTATNEFLTTASITASTDWVFSMPTRRYSTAFHYGFTSSATHDGRLFTDLNGNALVSGYFLPGNTLVATDSLGNGRQICVKGITTSSKNREEAGVATVTPVVVSPSTPADPISFCGEATVLSINRGTPVAAGTGALKASVAVKDLDVTYAEGWMTITTPAGSTPPVLGAVAPAAGAINGLPVLGSAFSRAFAGANSFGLAQKHRFTR